MLLHQANTVYRGTETIILDIAAFKSPFDAASELMIIVLNGDTIGTEKGPMGRSDYIGVNSISWHPTITQTPIKQMGAAHTIRRIKRIEIIAPE
ncbi:hypothetical protein A7K91_17220 [Paenibacillus oryzae]|uniref:Uncharacterized protein n=1 Tax=Paenibacillus oryzae TaxID=1844972 RepID=A0A1A5YJN9_9BACL|nr:hypothetical protein A7K91_17220 [Paenibacillus oryzae]